MKPRSTHPQARCLRRPGILMATVCVVAILVANAPAALAAEPADVLDTGKRVVTEVIDSLRRSHVDGDKFELTEYRSAAIAAMVRHVEAPDFSLLKGKARRDLVRDLWAVEIAGGDAVEPVFEVLQRHLPDLDDEQGWKLIDVVARGAIATTGDPFTQFLEQSMLGKLMKMMQGGRPSSFGFRPQRGPDRVWRVGHVSSGYDASLFDLRTGDVILETNGRPLGVLPTTQISALFSGEGPAADGKPVRFRIWRKGWETSHVVTLRFRQPQSENVSWALLDGGVGYIRLGMFMGKVMPDVKAALAKLHAAGMKALIFDVRGNPGGAINICVALTDLFLAEGKVITTTKTRSRPKGGERPRGMIPGMSGSASPSTFKSNGRGTEPRYPMAVLINHTSASASEMFGGALRDHGRAVLVGETTYGKGVGQGPVFLPSAFGKRFMLLTQLTYFNPAGKTPQHKGVPPHVEVESASSSAAASERVATLMETEALRAWVTRALKANPARARAAALGRRRLPALELLVGDAPEDTHPAIRNAARAALRRALKTAAEDDPSLARALAVDPRHDAALAKAAEILRESLASGGWPVPKARRRRVLY